MSFWEFGVILMVALIVIKPDRLPEITYYTGCLLGRLKKWYERLNTFY
jgi:Sec-independent protein translocase protein TatA